MGHRRFKALRALVILYVEQGNSDKMLARYQLLLTYISHVTSNESLEAINRLAGRARGFLCVYLVWNPVYAVRVACVRAVGRD